MNKAKLICATFHKVTRFVPDWRGRGWSACRGAKDGEVEIQECKGDSCSVVLTVKGLSFKDVKGICKVLTDGK